PDTNVQVSAGILYASVTPTTQGSQRVRVKNTTTATVPIPSNTSGSTKYDYIYLALDPTNANAPSLLADNVGSFVVSRSSSASVDNGSTTPAFGYLLAVVTV